MGKNFSETTEDFVDLSSVPTEKLITMFDEDNQVPLFAAFSVESDYDVYLAHKHKLDRIERFCHSRGICWVRPAPIKYNGELWKMIANQAGTTYTEKFDLDTGEELTPRQIATKIMGPSRAELHKDKDGNISIKTKDTNDSSRQRKRRVRLLKEFYSNQGNEPKRAYGEKESHDPEKTERFAAELTSPFDKGFDNVESITCKTLEEIEAMRVAVPDLPEVD